ncbi:MAG: type III pantothenate kinase [Bacteroidales bacterium]|nr:type III pantothenate kinase [Bacteroidales bacterium]
MKLIVDIGNTKVKTGVFDGKELVASQSYDAWCRDDWRRLWQRFPIESGILATVSGCPDWVAAETAGIPFLLWDRFRPELTLRYPVCGSYDVAKLGRDRIAISVALRCLYPRQSVLGIGMGSCITYNLVRADGRFDPGAISPGVYMRLRGMHTFTHSLPQAELDWQADTWPTPVPVSDSETALRAGAVEGVRYELEGFIRRYRAEFGDIPVVLTGGDAGYFEFSPKKRIFARPNLALFGLNEILDDNK